MDFVITHLDGTKLRIQNTPGEVIKPDDIKTIPDKGLPFHKQNWKYGNLFVMFKVTFPSSLTTKQVSEASSALHDMKRADEDMECKETVKLQNYSEAQRNTRATGGTQAADSDEDDEDDPRRGGGQRVQCAQQ